MDTIRAFFPKAGHFFRFLKKGKGGLPLFSPLVARLQCGFKLGDSCINQLLSITHKIYNSFDEGLEVKSVFLDISKAFDKVCHKGLLFKLSQNGISGNLLDLLSSFVSDRKQRFLLNGRVSKCYRRRSSRFHFGTIIIFDIHKQFLFTYPLKQNCSPMIHLYFPWRMI